MEPTESAEQRARDMLDRIGDHNACSYSSGDLVELANLIAMSDRFKVDVAYMPVPRCDLCAHWVPVKHLEHTWSACEELSTGTVASTEGDDVIQTRADFGCVQWKENLNADL